MEATSVSDEPGARNSSPDLPSKTCIPTFTLDLRNRVSHSLYHGEE